MNKLQKLTFIPARYDVPSISQAQNALFCKNTFIIKLACRISRNSYNINSTMFYTTRITTKDYKNFEIPKEIITLMDQRKKNKSYPNDYNKTCLEIRLLINGEIPIKEQMVDILRALAINYWDNNAFFNIKILVFFKEFIFDDQHNDIFQSEILYPLEIAITRLLDKYCVYHDIDIQIRLINDSYGLSLHEWETNAPFATEYIGFSKQEINDLQKKITWLPDHVDCIMHFNDSHPTSSKDISIKRTKWYEVA